MRVVLIATIAVLTASVTVAPGQRDRVDAPAPPGIGATAPPPDSAAVPSSASAAPAEPIPVPHGIPLSSTANATPSSADPSQVPRERLPSWLEEGIRRHGPITVFFAFILTGVGLHLSEDLILIPVGFLAAADPHESRRLFWEFAFWAYLGIVIGDSGWFLLCRVFGTRFLHGRWFRRLMHPRRILELKHQMDRRGAWVLLAARFIPGARTPVITMGGLLHMPWLHFLAVELPCVMLTVPMQMGVGWLAARAASSAGVTALSHQIAIGVSVTAGAALALGGVHLWIRAKISRQRLPRSPARWLRLYSVRSQR